MSVGTERKASIKKSLQGLHYALTVRDQLQRLKDEGHETFVFQHVPEGEKSLIEVGPYDLERFILLIDSRVRNSLEQCRRVGVLSSANNLLMFHKNRDTRRVLTEGV